MTVGVEIHSQPPLAELPMAFWHPAAWVLAFASRLQLLLLSQGTSCFFSYLNVVQCRQPRLSHPVSEDQRGPHLKHRTPWNPYLKHREGFFLSGSLFFSMRVIDTSCDSDSFLTSLMAGVGRAAEGALSPHIVFGHQERSVLLSCERKPSSSTVPLVFLLLHCHVEDLW